MAQKTEYDPFGEIARAAAEEYDAEEREIREFIAECVAVWGEMTPSDLVALHSSLLHRQDLIIETQTPEDFEPGGFLTDIPINLRLGIQAAVVEQLLAIWHDQLIFGGDIDSTRRVQEAIERQARGTFMRGIKAFFFMYAAMTEGEQEKIVERLNMFAALEEEMQKGTSAQEAARRVLERAPRPKSSNSEESLLQPYRRYRARLAEWERLAPGKSQEAP